MNKFSTVVNVLSNHHKTKEIKEVSTIPINVSEAKMVHHPKQQVKLILRCPFVTKKTNKKLLPSMRHI